MSISRRVFGLAAAFALCLLAVSASAFDIIPPQGQPVVVVLNEGTLLRLDTSPQSSQNIFNVYVADPNTQRIQKFTSTGSYLTQSGGFGTATVCAAP